MNALNLAVRFLLELAALVALGFWGWNQADGLWSFALAFAFPVIAATLWGVFAVPDDPSRSGNAPVPVPGIARLLLELGFFAAAVYCLQSLHYPVLAWIFGITTLLHYLASYNRLRWLLRQ